MIDRFLKHLSKIIRYKKKIIIFVCAILYKIIDDIILYRTFKNGIDYCDFKFIDTDNFKKLKYDQVLLIKKQADDICNHKFNVLGLQDYYVGNAIKWNCDFISGYEWPMRFYRLLNINAKKSKVDIKVPWELSRFNHLLLLGEAYKLSNDIKYINEFKNEIDSWIKNNRYQYGINWSCSMEVAIRAINLILSFQLFREVDNKIKYDVSWKKYINLIYLHGNHIFKNLEYKERGRSNHYIANLVGLLFIGMFFKHTKRGSNWLEFAVKELEKEIDVQVLADGVDYESSTYYHCFVTEMIVYSLILLKKNGMQVSQNFENKVEIMCTFIKSISKPNGLIPQIGDTDNGRLLKFIYSVPLDFREIICLSSCLFNKEELMLSLEDITNISIISSILIFGYFKYTKASNNKIFKVYEQSKYIVYKDDRIYFITHLGDVGKGGVGGHGHNNALGFELNIDGEDIFIDPGSYCYSMDKELRNHFRSTSAHNTVMINNEEQNSINNGLFTMLENSHSRIIQVIESENDVKIVGCHFAYQNLGVEVYREFVISKVENKILINDNIKKINNHKINLKWYFHCSPSILLKPNEGYVSANKQNIHICVFYDSKCSYSQIVGKYSPSYGLYEENNVMEFFYDTDSTESFTFTIEYDRIK